MISKLFLSATLILLIAGCQLRSYNNSKSSSKNDDTGAAAQIDAKAFNAFKIWQDGTGEPIYSYPVGYNLEELKNEGADGIFYVDVKEYWLLKSSPSESSKRFVAERTANIQKNKESGKLSYPANKQVRYQVVSATFFPNKTS